MRRCSTRPPAAHTRMLPARLCSLLSPTVAAHSTRSSLWVPPAHLRLFPDGSQVIRRPGRPPSLFTSAREAAVSQPRLRAHGRTCPPKGSKAIETDVGAQSLLDHIRGRDLWPLNHLMHEHWTVQRHVSVDLLEQLIHDLSLRPEAGRCNSHQGTISIRVTDGLRRKGKQRRRHNDTRAHGEYEATQRGSAVELE